MVCCDTCLYKLLAWQVIISCHFHVTYPSQCINLTGQYQYHIPLITMVDALLLKKHQHLKESWLPMWLYTCIVFFFNQVDENQSSLSITLHWLKKKPQNQPSVNYFMIGQLYIKSMNWFTTHIYNRCNQSQNLPFL